LQNDTKIPKLIKEHIPKSHLSEEKSLEATVLKLIANRSIWDIELLRQITQATESAYKIAKINDENYVTMESSFDSTNSDNRIIYQDSKYSKNPAAYHSSDFDNFCNPLFIVAQNILKTPNTDKKRVNIVKETQSYAALAQCHLPPAIPTIHSQPFENEQSDIENVSHTSTRIHRTMRPGSTKILKPELELQDDDQESLQKFGWNSQVDGFYSSERCDEFTEKPYEYLKTDLTPESTTRLPSRCSTAKSLRSIAPKFFPKSVGDFGGLGPDKDNESYLLKVITAFN
jgi:hypothetical protein